ncbi:S41 family peptidase [Niabella aquatica]
MKRSFLTILLLSFFFIAHAQNISAGEKTAIIEKAKQLLTEHFISNEKSKIVSDSLNDSQFKAVNNRTEFVKRLNKLLFQYTKDKHLSVEYNPNYAKELESNRDDKVEQAAKERKENYGFEQTNILSGNVGYIRLRYFADTGNSKQAALKALGSVAGTKSLILDLRGNSGGSGSMVQLLCSSFLPARGEPLLQIIYRRGDTVTLKTYTDTSRMIYANPIFILCDHNTFSAAEAFTLIMKNRQRAVIIGGTTAGAGNIAGPHFLTHDFIITIPVGKIVDPLTGKGWEGIGVLPDIEADCTQPLK